MDIPLYLFWLKKLISVLVLPPLAPLVLVGAGLLVLQRRPRLGRTLAWGGLLLALVLITPVSVGLLLAGLENIPPLSPEAARSARAIVILGAGQRRHAPEYGGPTVNRLALERLRYGARLARSTRLPILVTGGATGEATPEAGLMKDVLERDFGVQVRWTESASLDTRDNARNSAAILKDAGITRVLLVSHAAHLPRALAEFRAAGIDPIPAPTAWFSGPTDNELTDLFPGANAAYAGWFATHEWVGLAAHRLRR